MSYRINERDYDVLHDLKTELSIQPQKDYCFDLPHLTVIHVAGENALAFLQGQLSCDTRQITAQQMHPGVICNLKGRVLAIVHVVLWQNHGVYLVVPADLADATINSLSKTAILSRITLTLHPEIKLFGLMVQNKENPLFANLLPDNRYAVKHDEGLCCYKLDSQFALIMVQPASKDAWESRYANTLLPRGGLAWHLQQLKLHRVEIYPESRGLFLPHYLDLHHLGYLNFEKGCYKGQEIIARMHFRSTIKYHLAHFQMSASCEQLRSGMTVYAENNDTAIGELIDFCPVDNDCVLIVVSILLQFSGKARVEKAGSFSV